MLRLAPEVFMSPHPPFGVHVVTSENRRFYAPALEASFRLRHRIYVSERKWEIFQRPDGREVDCYDNGETIYLLAIEEVSRRLVGCARLYPTIHAPPLAEIKGLGGGYPLPRSPTVFHLSRVIIAPERRGPCFFNLPTAAIYAAVQEYCLAENIEQLSLLLRMSLLPALLELGWNPLPLALPEVLWGTSCVVATVDVSEIALARTQKLRGIEGSVLVRRGITRPAVSQPLTTRAC
jgi:acyl-homoserine lactone synthase